MVFYDIGIEVLLFELEMCQFSRVTASLESETFSVVRLP